MSTLSSSFIEKAIKDLYFYNNLTTINTKPNYLNFFFVRNDYNNYIPETFIDYLFVYYKDVNNNDRLIQVPCCTSTDKFYSNIDFIIGDYTIPPQSIKGSHKLGFNEKKVFCLSQSDDFLLTSGGEKLNVCNIIPFDNRQVRSGDILLPKLEFKKLMKLLHIHRELYSNSFDFVLFNKNNV